MLNTRRIKRTRKSYHYSSQLFIHEIIYVTDHRTDIEVHQQYTKHLFICKRERKGHACTSSQPLELTQSQHSLYWVNTRPTPHPFPNNPQSSVLALALVNTPPPPFPKQPSELTQSQHDLVNPPHPPRKQPSEFSPSIRPSYTPPSPRPIPTWWIPPRPIPKQPSELSPVLSCCLTSTEATEMAY